MELMDNLNNKQHTQLCETHKRISSFVSLLPNNTNLFLCNQCLLSYQNKNQTLISVEGVCQAKESEPIRNWPLGMDTSYYIFMKTQKTENLRSSMQKGIHTFFDQLSENINQILSQSKKKLILESERIQIGSDDELINLYNILFKKKELQDIFLNKEIIGKDRYQSLIKSLSETSQKDLQQFSEQVEERKSNQRQFRQFQQLELHNLLNEIISNINNLSSFYFAEKEKKQEDSQIFEKYHFSQCMTVRQLEALRNDKNRFPDVTGCLKDDIMELYDENPDKLVRIIHQYDNRSGLLFEDQDHYKLDYDRRGVIKVSNPNNLAGSLSSSLTTGIDEKISFELKFFDKTSFMNFRLRINLETDNGTQKRIYNFAKTFKRVCDHIEKANLPLKFKIDLNVIDDQFSITASDGWSTSRSIIIEEIEASYYYFDLMLEESCAEFEISEFQEILIDIPIEEQSEIKENIHEMID